MTTQTVPLSGITVSVLFVVGVTIIYVFGQAIYNLYFHPLASYPGPVLARISRLWYINSLLKGRLPFDVADLHTRYGEVVRIAPDELAYIDPSIWQEAYGHRLGRGEIPKDPLFYENTSSGTLSVNGAPGQRHAELRRLLSHGFSEKALRSQEQIIQAYANLFVEKLKIECKKENHVDMVKWYNFFTFDVIGHLAYGESFDCLETGSYHPWVTLLFGNVKVGSMLRVSEYYPLFKSILHRCIPATLLENRRRHGELSREKALHRLQNQDEQLDLVSRIAAPGALTLQEFIANTGILIVAGSETTATLLSGITYYLVRSPDILQKLVSEVRSTFKSDEEITFVKVNSLKYMLACLNETMRLYPPVPGGLPRRTRVDEVLAGKFVPKNTTISVYQYAMYRAPGNFSHPDEFLPERWLENTEFEEDRKAALRPFHVGPRNCIGKNLAYFEMRLILAKLLFHFDIHWTAVCHNWAEDQRVFLLWEKSPLTIRLTAVSR